MKMVNKIDNNMLDGLLNIVKSLDFYDTFTELDNKDIEIIMTCIDQRLRSDNNRCRGASKSFSEYGQRGLQITGKCSGENYTELNDFCQWMRGMYEDNGDPDNPEGHELRPYAEHIIEKTISLSRQDIDLKGKSLEWMINYRKETIEYSKKAPESKKEESPADDDINSLFGDYNDTDTDNPFACSDNPEADDGESFAALLENSMPINEEGEEDTDEIIDLDDISFTEEIEEPPEKRDPRFDTDRILKNLDDTTDRDIEYRQIQSNIIQNLSDYSSSTARKIHEYFISKSREDKCYILFWLMSEEYPLSEDTIYVDGKPLDEDQIDVYNVMKQTMPPNIIKNCWIIRDIMPLINEKGLLYQKIESIKKKWKKDEKEDIDIPTMYQHIEDYEANNTILEHLESATSLLVPEKDKIKRFLEIEKSLKVEGENIYKILSGKE